LERGTVVILSTIRLLAASVTIWIEDSVVSDWDGSFYLFIVSAGGAGVLTVLTTGALRQRHGGLGALGLAALIIAGVGLAVTVWASWALRSG
jgi:hypothetical protein